MTRSNQGNGMLSGSLPAWAVALVASLLLLGGLLSPWAVAQDTELSVLQDIRTEMQGLRTDVDTLQDEQETALNEGLQEIYLLGLFAFLTGLFVFGLDRGIPR